MEREQSIQATRSESVPFPSALVGGLARLGWAVACALALTGCGREPRLYLAAGDGPLPTESALPMATHNADGSSAQWTLESAGRDGWWARVDYAQADWREGPAPGVWEASRGLRALGKPPADGAPETFVVPGLAVTARPLAEALSDPASLRPGAYGTVGDRLFLFTGGPAPERAHSRVFVPAARREHGLSRADLPGISGEGWVLPVGTAVEQAGWSRGAAVLWFSAAAYAVGEGSLQSVRIRVEAAGQSVGEVDLVPSSGPRPELFQFALDERLARGPLRFSARGPAAVVGLWSPILAPVQGTRLPERPDLVVFLADTLRADALSVYRDSPGRAPAAVSPHLDRFAQDARVFLRAFSVSSWTLPSHGTLFTGLAPEQHGATKKDRTLPRDLTTIAERLRAEGYRTEATTDSGFLEPAFGMDQGFELFATRATHLTDQERALPNLLQQTERALARDDGRPLFLFAHTYRTHVPYHVSTQSVARLAAPVDLSTPWTEFSERAEARFPGALVPSAKAEVSDFLAEFGAELRWRYYGGVMDLDQGFADFLKLLEQRGVLERGALLFTSDHGEAFGEHGELFHEWNLFDEVTRIPLIARGPRFPVGVDPRPVSLADLAPTLADLAGIAFANSGPGRSLLGALEADRRVFQHTGYGQEEQRGVVAFPVRYVFEPDGSLTLGEWGERGPERVRRDPSAAERANAQLERERYDRLLERFVRAPETVALGREEMARLQQLGYLGD